jgi:hypothetical protein
MLCRRKEKDGKDQILPGEKANLKDRRIAESKTL